jgi:hypothetical protein
MMARLSAAWTRAFAEVWPDDWGIYKAIGALWVLGVIFCGFFFAVHDHGRVNILVSFVGGLVTGVFLFLLTYGPILLWLFLAIFLSRLTTDHEEPTKRAQTISFITSLIAVAALWIVTLDFVKTLPVVGDQITFMFRDEDDD